ncbi:hypothetical protein GJAV_G00125950 [Gymnothorax javanicus]|nr:hypothetical protein GJAV_G00125950 [Gymnothorax javanicus]
MEGWRGPAVGTGEAKLKFELLRSQLGDGAQHIKQEKEDERKPTDPTTIIVKQEEISDVPCKVPKFQYVDFPSLHQCIQQLAIPPLETWIARCPAGWARGRGSRDTAERVPKFKYVDYPSLHHCIQQLSVPPLESWSSRLPRAASSGGIPETAALTPPGTLTERQGSLVLGHKRDRDAALPGPSPGLAQKKKSASDMSSYKALNSLCDTHQPEAGPVIGSDRGEPHTETTNGSEFQRPVHLGPDRASAQIKSDVDQSRGVERTPEESSRRVTLTVKLQSHASSHSCLPANTVTPHLPSLWKHIANPYRKKPTAANQHLQEEGQSHSCIPKTPARPPPPALRASTP